MDCDYVRVYPGILKSVVVVAERTRARYREHSLLRRTQDGFRSIRVTSSSTTQEVIARALLDFGLHNVNADKYSLVEVLLISNINYTDRILEPDERPLHVLRQQRKVTFVAASRTVLIVAFRRNLFAAIV